MRRTLSFLFIAALIALALFAGTRKMLAQSNVAPSLITRAPDDSQRVFLRGNVHPSARPENDQGLAPSNRQMGHMFLVLRRSPQQQAALDAFNAQQADKNSPNYHHWLTPAEFGQQFGASDQDISEVTAWLGSHGFQVASVSPGRNMIDFTGTAGQIQEAFRTEIHHYLVNGESHFANAADPQVPAAFASAVAGVRGLSDFRPKPMVHTAGAFKMQMSNHKVNSVQPEFTYTSPSASSNCYSNSSTCFAVGPYDFATIYNLLPLWTGGNTGTGEKIAIVSDSDVQTIDYTQFRSLMGLPALTLNRILPTGVNPGLQGPACAVNQDETEAIADVEWSGAAAPGATIDLVIAPSVINCNNVSAGNENDGYTSGFGGDFAAFYAVNTLNDPILSDSYGLCELELGQAGNSFYENLWQQADTQGITVLVASGDGGAAGCDAGSNAPAVDGLQVNGTASTPHDVAVGGTEFNYIFTNINTASTYWNSSNTTSGSALTLSAKGPIPETVYNDSCTSPQLFSFLGGSSANGACNSSVAANLSIQSPPGVLLAAGGSGGSSSCTAPTGLAVTDCAAGGYPKPTWQTAATPADSARDIPDVSLFAGDGSVSGTFYLVCQQDFAEPKVAATDCSITSGQIFFGGIGGTSISAQAMAGIVAVLDQAHGKRYGSTAFNTQMYLLAAAETFANCNNSGSTPLASSSPCIFKDVTAGTNSTPCVTNSRNCGSTITSDVAPRVGPLAHFRWTPTGLAMLVCSLCAATFLFLQPTPRRRWSAALALVVFGAMFGVVSCGGGSGNGSIGGGGGGGNGVGVLSGYNAAVGYDRATGLGSVNAANLVNAPGW